MLRTIPAAAALVVVALIIVLAGNLAGFIGAVSL